MIEKMTKYSFILMSEGSQDFISRIQDLGVVDITRSSVPVDEETTALLSRMEFLGKCIKDASETDFDGSGVEICGTDYAEQFAEAGEKLSQIEESLADARREREDRLAWGAFDKEAITRLEAAGCHIRYYKVAAKRFNPQWEQDYALARIAEDGKNIWFVTADATGNGYDFPLTECPAPEAPYTVSDEMIATLEEEAREYRAKLGALKAFVPQMEEARRITAARLDACLAEAGKSESSEGLLTIFEGYAPSSDDGRLRSEFDSMDVLWISGAAVTDDNPPISFRNNRFVRMFEVLTDMYGRPAYDGFDPTPYISVFFLLFFAMCMGDAGYGLILIAGGFLLKKVKSFASFAPLVSVLGVATVVVGFFFHTFFSVDISTWKCIPDAVKSIFVPAKIAGYDGTMVVSLIVGIIHLCLAMTVKTVYATRNKGFLASLSTWGWTLLIVGGVIVGVIALLGVIDMAVTKWIIIALGIVSAIGIFFLNDLHRNPLLNIGAGLWETYNTATGLLGDVLSYLRLYALGLAGSMLGFAFNDMGRMALGDGGSIGGWAAFLLIVIIGHTLNLAMAALGAFVHPLRLNFLEFFKNSGYEGTGRIYKPMTK